MNTLTPGNAALNVNGGAVINNGLEVNQGLRVTGPSQGQGFQTIDMGGNRVQDVGTPIFGTDAANKAYVDRGLRKAYEGTAIALAISQPIIGPNQTFAIRTGWGSFENENAFGLSAAGIIGRDWFWNGSTVALDGGVGSAPTIPWPEKLASRSPLARRLRRRASAEVATLRGVPWALPFVLLTAFRSLAGGSSPTPIGCSSRWLLPVR